MRISYLAVTVPYLDKYLFDALFLNSSEYITRPFHPSANTLALPFVTENGQLEIIVCS